MLIGEKKRDIKSVFFSPGLEASGPRPHALLQQRTRQAVHLPQHRQRRHEGGDASGEPHLHLRRGRHPEDEGSP